MERVRRTLPIRGFPEWCIGRRLPNPNRVSHLRGRIRIGDMDSLGFEPRASSLQGRHSTAEL